MTTLTQLMSGDAVWAILAAVIIPSLGALWWHVITKTSHLYSKIAEVKEDLAIKNEQLLRLRHDLKNVTMNVEWNTQKLAARDSDINYLFWELNKEMPRNEHEGIKAEGSSNRQSIRRPQQP